MLRVVCKVIVWSILSPVYPPFGAYAYHMIVGVSSAGVTHRRFYVSAADRYALDGHLFDAMVLHVAIHGREPNC